MPSSKVKNILIPVSCLFRGSIQHVLKLVSQSTEGVQDRSLWHKNYFELKAFENRFFFFPNPLIFLKQSLPKELNSRKSASLEFPNQGRWFLPTGREKSTPHVNRHCHKTLRLLIYYLREPSIIFPKSHLFSHKLFAFTPFHVKTSFTFPEVPFSPFPSPIKMLYKPQFLITSWNHICLWTSIPILIKILD